jgi:hypothetical protein
MLLASPADSCRICGDSNAAGALLSVCACAGAQVHAQCLQRWVFRKLTPKARFRPAVGQHYDMTLVPIRDRLRCEVCLVGYAIKSPTMADALISTAACRDEARSDITHCNCVAPVWDFSFSLCARAICCVHQISVELAAIRNTHERDSARDQVYSEFERLVSNGGNQQHGSSAAMADIAAQSPPSSNSPLPLAQPLQSANLNPATAVTLLSENARSAILLLMVSLAMIPLAVIGILLAGIKAVADMTDGAGVYLVVLIIAISIAAGICLLCLSKRLAADDAARETAAKEQSTRRLCLAVRARFSRGRAARVERDRMSAESQLRHLDILREAS